MGKPNLDELAAKLLWTDEECAFVLGVTSDTVRNLHRTKQLSGCLCGKHLRWHRTSVEEFAEALRQNGKGGGD